MNTIKILVAASIGGCVLATGAQAQVTASSPVQSGFSAAIVDFSKATPMPVPVPKVAPALQQGASSPASLNSFYAPAGMVSGSAGSGELAQVQLIPALKFPADQAAPQASGIAPQDFGTLAQVFTTSRVDASGDNTQYYYPFSAAGKLFFNIGAASYVCSASLIKPGLVVTAAHCVANFGKSQFYSGWTFVPAYNNGIAPYGTWTAATARIMTSYYNGTDSCAQSGVICQDDVAVIALNKQNNTLPGTRTGYLGYGYNGYGYNSSNQALISQLGYPVSLDSGVLMERTDSQGYTSASYSNNTLIGSAMTGGSSGGPWVVNLGIQPSGYVAGSAPLGNAVVGVTSWGYTSTAQKVMGAAPFTSGNILALINAQCSATPGVC